MAERFAHVPSADPESGRGIADSVPTEMLARCTFPAERALPLDVAVSGGADSTALLVLAVASRDPGAAVIAHHVDHRLRPNGEAEAQAVAALADRFGARFVSHSVEVGDGPNLEERCRVARFAVLPPGCLVGHTMDDQAETLLQRIMRGTGAIGLAAMDSRTHPILNLRRSDTEELCESLGISPLQDPSNTDPRFSRNRVRSELLPLMASISGRDPVPLLARLAQHAGELREALVWAALGVDPTDARAVASVPPGIAHAVLITWWGSETNGLPNPDTAAVGRMLDVARGNSVRAEIGRGWRIERTHQRLRLTGPQQSGNVEARE